MLKTKGWRKIVAGILVAAALGSSTLPVMAAETGKVTADLLNLRSGKSLTSSIVGKIPQNTTLTIQEKSGNWYKVTYDGKTGYVSADYVTLTTDTTTTGVVNATTLNVRKSGSTGAEIVGTLKNGTVINLVSKSGDWYYMTYGSLKGYVSAEFVKEQAMSGKVNVNGGLNVRASASTSAAKVGVLKNGAAVTILSTSGSWYYITSGSLKGYVYKSYIKVTGNTTTGTSSGTDASQGSASNPVKGNIFKCNVSSLRVRKSPSTDAAIVAGLVKGNQVTFVEVASNKNWYKITTSKGVTGYVAKEYLTFYSVGKPSSSSSSSSGSSSNSNPPVNQTAAQKIVSTAKKYLGVKYVYGGTTPKGFDCSGFTQYVFKQCGYSISRTSRTQATNGTAVKKSELQVGDLVFFSSYRGQSTIGHVGIYIGGGQFIHASSGTGYCVKISSLSEPFYVDTYKSARRILK